MAEKESAHKYEGPTSCQELREKHARMLINFYAPESFSEVKYESVQEKLDKVLLHPINAISSIVNEEEPNCEVDSIVFPPLKDLALQVIERKKSGENSKDIQKLKDEIEQLKRDLDEANGDKSRKDEEIGKMVQTIASQCEKSPNEKVQGLAGAVKSATEDRSKLIEMVMSTLNTDIKQKISTNNVLQSKADDLEKLNFHLKSSNQQLQNDIERAKKRYDMNLEEMKNDYERKIDQMKQTGQVKEGLINFREALEKAKQDMMEQINQQRMNSPRSPKSPRRADGGSAKKEMNEKLDAMMAKINESNRKNQLFEDCLRSLQNTLNTIDGEGISFAKDFGERTLSIQKRLINIRNKSEVTKEELTKACNDIISAAKQLDPQERASFYETKIQEIARKGEQLIKIKDCAEERSKNLQETINRVENAVLELEQMLHITDGPNNEISSRISKIRDEISSHL